MERRGAAAHPGLALGCLLLIFLKYRVRARIREENGHPSLPLYVAFPLVLLIAGVLAYLRFSR
jgi:hypothetical protein